MEEIKSIQKFFKERKGRFRGAHSLPGRPETGLWALTIRLMEASLLSRPSLSIANFFGRKESLEEQIL